MWKPYFFVVVESKGGKALPCIVDIQSEEQVKSAFDQAVDKFGGVDILVNNASAIHLTGTEITPMKRYDLMNNINTRGTFMWWVISDPKVCWGWCGGWGGWGEGLVRKGLWHTDRSFVLRDLQFAHSDGSKISQEGAPTLRRGGLLFSQIFLRSAWKWRKLAREGWGHQKFVSVHPPLVHIELTQVIQSGVHSSTIVDSSDSPAH